MNRGERQKFLLYLMAMLTLFVAWSPIGYWSFGLDQNTGLCHGVRDYIAGNDFPYGRTTSSGLRIVSMFSYK